MSNFTDIEEEYITQALESTDTIGELEGELHIRKTIKGDRRADLEARLLEEAIKRRRENG